MPNNAAHDIPPLRAPYLVKAAHSLPIYDSYLDLQRDTIILSYSLPREFRPHDLSALSGATTAFS